MSGLGLPRIKTRGQPSVYKQHSHGYILELKIPQLKNDHNLENPRIPITENEIKLYNYKIREHIRFCISKKLPIYSLQIKNKPGWKFFFKRLKTESRNSLKFPGDKIDIPISVNFEKKNVIFRIKNRIKEDIKINIVPIKIDPKWINLSDKVKEPPLIKKEEITEPEPKKKVKNSFNFDKFIEDLDSEEISRKSKAKQIINDLESGAFSNKRLEKWYYEEFIEDKIENEDFYAW